MSHITDLLDQIPPFGRPARKREYQNAAGTTIVELFPQFQHSADEAAPTLYFSSIPVNTTLGPTNIGFAIPAESLEEACDKWRACAQEAVKRFILEVEDSRKRVILPGGKDLPPFQKRIS